jgi:hypothetical protein
MKVSTIWAVGVICLVAGAGLGALVSIYFGYGELPGTSPRRAAPSGPPSMVGMPVTTGEAPAGGKMGGGSPGGKMGGGSPGGMMGGGPGMGGMGGGRGPSAKNQLAALVTKLELLTDRALSINLADEQKPALDEQIRGLDTMDELADEEAQKRLDALLDLLADHKDTLVAAGYRWPGDGGFRPPADTPNPFADGSAAEALKLLQERLATPANP